MTPCENLGYKVGDRFEVIGDGVSTPIEVGDIITLYRDDGTETPFFCREGEEFSYNCAFLSSLRLLKPQTEAERRGAKFGTMGVVKATGERVVFAKERINYGVEKWYFLTKSRPIVSSTIPTEIRLDHEPEYKEIPFSKATDEQRMEVGNLVYNGSETKVSDIKMFSNGTFGFTLDGMGSVLTSTNLLTVRVPA